MGWISFGLFCVRTSDLLAVVTGESLVAEVSLVNSSTINDNGVLEFASLGFIRRPEVIQVESAP